jgi:biopolymer transport protein ExbD
MGHLRRRRKHREPLDLSLNITSLMDVLTVLLFFLLKSISVSATSQETMAGIRLPASDVKGQFEETVTVALSKDELRADGTLLMKLDHGRFSTLDISVDQRTLLPLQQYLQEQFAKKNLIFKGSISNSELPPGKILIQADKELGFSALKYLLHTAAVTGYSDYQFVVNNPES